MCKAIPKSLYLDFEFNRTTHEKVNLVSCVTYDPNTNEISEFWLHNNAKNQQLLSKRLKEYKTIIGYACVAEARSFISLGLEPLDWQWYDEFLEYRMITNHNDRMLYGEQLVDGKVKTFKKPKPKYERKEDDEDRGFKPTHSLAEATFKLTGQIRDTDEKAQTRKLIISDPKEFTKEEQKRILKYNRDDVLFLEKIFKAIRKEYQSLLHEDEEIYLKNAFFRGRYSAHTAWMETRGYPINYETTKNFSSAVPLIIDECQRDINSQFPGTFRWNKRYSNYSWNQKNTRAWLEKNVDQKKWMKTKKGALGLSLEAFERQFHFQHSYPRNNYPAQIVRFLKLKQSLYGFNESKGSKRKSFWDSVGPDGRVRYYANIFGAQSSRSQPASSGFIPLKAAWMRYLIQPKKGNYICGIDYGQQEFFLAGLLSEDLTMIDAYLSGDPYLYGAKLAGAIPQDGTKDTHKFERNIFKNTYLGILYGMSKYGLALKLTSDVGRKFTEDEAQHQIDLFYESFTEYKSWKYKMTNDYYNEGEIAELPDGWKMFIDNDNHRSVSNFHSQGFGATIMRKAVDIGHKKGCKVIYTLHDAIYIEDSIKNLKSINHLRDAMVEAFAFHFKDTPMYEYALQIKYDPFAWSPNFKKDSAITVGDMKIPCSDFYEDERAIEELNKFKQYFESPDWAVL